MDEKNKFLKENIKTLETDIKKGLYIGKEASAYDALKMMKEVLKKYEGVNIDE